jgi:hypothetical protein
MFKHEKPRNGILLCETPEAWQPTSPWEIPPATLKGVLFAVNVPLEKGLRFCNEYNCRELESGIRDRLWAILVRRGHVPLDRACDPQTAWPVGHQMGSLSALPPKGRLPDPIAGNGDEDRTGETGDDGHGVRLIVEDLGEASAHLHDEER